MASNSPRSAVRANMPHVVTQWHAEKSELEMSKSRTQLQTPKIPSEYLIPIWIEPSYRKRVPNIQSPSLASSAISAHEPWDFGSIRQIRQYSSSSNTPISAVESVFELPSADIINSPNSSIHSYYVAELEDTSPCPSTISARPRGHSSPVKPSVVSPSMMEFKTTQITSRAVIQVVDETIAAIEDTNRKLLCRVEAAEEVAKQLREQNSELQQRIKLFSHNQSRPKTAPAQAPPLNRARNKPSISNFSDDPTPLSAFNDSFGRAQTLQRQTRSHPPPPRRSHLPPSTPLTRPTNSDIAPNPFHDSGFPSPPHYQRHAPLSPNSQSPPVHFRCHSASRDLEISMPIPGSVSRHEVTYAGAPISCRPRAEIISLEEARRRAKPLPPLGPMSPSVLRGVVEIGSGSREGQDWRAGRELAPEKRKRGFNRLFRRGKKERFLWGDY